MVDAARGWAEFAWGLEEPLTFVAAVASAVLAFRFFPFGLHRLVADRSALALGLVRLALLAGLAWILFALLALSSSDIVGFYNFEYGGLAIASMLLLSYGPSILRIRHRVDVVEGGNLAAAWVLAGFTLGTAFAFAGALSGEDLSGRTQPDGVPVGGWHVVLAFFLLAYFELRANLKLVDRLGDLEDEARADRDVSAGVLLFGVATASGIVSGRAAAGDFLSWGDAMQDYFVRLWPLPLIPIVAMTVARLTAGSDRALRARAWTSLTLIASAMAYAIVTWFRP